MHILGEKKRKRALKLYNGQLKEITEMYFLEKEYLDRKKEKEIPKNYYVYKVSEICEKFKFSNAILRFLVLYYVGIEVKYCEFCGHTIKKIKFRESQYDFVDDCNHNGICSQCEKPCRIDAYGFCFRCNPRHDPDPEVNHINTPINYLMADCLGRCSFSHIKNRETLKALKVYAMQIVNELDYLINQ